jgi:hypothetical protein
MGDLTWVTSVFWSREALEAIGNKLGSFVKLEPNWDSKKDRRWAWVLIEVDVREGLVGNIDLVYVVYLAPEGRLLENTFPVPRTATKLVIFTPSVQELLHCSKLLLEFGNPNLLSESRTPSRPSRWKEKM